MRDPGIEGIEGTDLDIAIIGMAGRFPGAGDLEQFWDNLKNGVESVAFFSKEDLVEAGLPVGKIEDPHFVTAYGALPDSVYECFDASFFNYTPAEAELMDPQMRLLHQCVWQALEDAGYVPDSDALSIGLYVGAAPHFNWEAVTSFSRKNGGMPGLTGILLNNKDFMSTRISYNLDLSGPSFTLHTACSTSLVAVDLACRGLLTGQCDMSLAGGVTLLCAPKRGYMYQEGMIYSPDGHTRSFDEKAGGSVFGDGVGMVVLKLLEDALGDRDSIHAVIKGSAVNNDGSRKVGYTAPGVRGQAGVIRAALHMAGVEAESIRYVEAHGTATPLGDPIEIKALTQAFHTHQRGFCALGTVKSNIGHLDAAAGIAGLIKTVLALKYRMIPPTLHLEHPNPAIDFENSPFYPVNRLTPWPQHGSPRRAGVSSFGIGGTNAHVIVEEAPETGEGASQRPYHLMLLSARTEAALNQVVRNLADFFKRNQGVNLADAAYTLQVGRKRFPHRQKLLCAHVQEAIHRLSTPESREIQTYAADDEGGDTPVKSVIFLFPGLGAQHMNMGRGLYEAEPVFRREMDRCFHILDDLGAGSVKACLYPGDSDSRQEEIRDVGTAQLAVFMVEYSLARLLMTWGIQPPVMMGYSFGEYAAACISGVFSLEDALQLLVTRGRLLQRLPPGLMFSVPLPPEKVKPMMTAELSIGIDNGESCVISGPEEAIASFEEQCREKRVMCMRLDASHAVHSKMMDPIREEFEQAVAAISLNPPRIPYISSVSGRRIRQQEATSPAYWGDQLRETVRFAEGVRQLIKETDALFLEVGVGRDVTALVKRALAMDGAAHGGHRALYLLPQRRSGTDTDNPDQYCLLDKIGRLWLYGASIHWPSFYAGQERHRVSLPTYPFVRQRFWKSIEQYREGGVSSPTGTGDLGDWFYLPSWKRREILGAWSPVEAADGDWLVLADPLGLAEGLADELKQGCPHCRPVTVHAGSAFRQHGDVEYTLNPRHYEHYEMLLARLRGRGVAPRRVVHLWGVTGEAAAGDDGEKLRQSHDRGFTSLMHLAKALGQRGDYTGEIEIYVVTDNMQPVTGGEHLEPGKATVLGPCRVIPQEYPGIRCRSIDLDGRYDQGRAVVRQLLEEMTIPAGNGSMAADSVVAYRGPYRWLQAFEPVRLEKPAAGESSPRLRQGGVYMIIGGLGDIGCILAEYLIKEYRAGIVITGRTEMGAGRLTHLQELAGDEGVLYCCADVADRAGMQAALRQGERHFGAIHGLIHSAGIVRGDAFNTIADMTESRCRLHFRAKLDGLMVLADLLKDKELDFCLLVSSISTVLGGLGFAAYAAANHFIDAFAAWYNRKQREPWVVVNWEGTGKEETIEAFQRIFACAALSQVVFSAGGDLEGKIARWVKLEGMEPKDDAGDDAPLYARPALSNPYVAPRNAVEEKLVGCWQRFFGIEPIGVTDDLFDLGGDSLKMITLISIIHREWRVTIPLKEFFDHPFIESVARYITGAKQDTSASIEPAEKREYYTLSAAQRRLYILQQMAPGSIAYNEPRVVLLEGELDRKRLEKSFCQLIRRHEVLRISLEMINGEPRQRVHAPGEPEFRFEYVDLTSAANRSKEGEDMDRPGRVNEMIRAFIRAFDLSRAPFLRAGLIKLHDPGRGNRHVLMIDMHHLVTDGLSQQIFVKDLMALYRGGVLIPLKLHYKDYSEWQNSAAQQEALQQQAAFWLKQFEGDIPLMELPTDYPRPAVQDFSGSFIPFEMEGGVLKQFALKEDVTLFMLLLSLLYLLLCRLSGQEDMVVGTPTAGRKRVELQEVMGLFVNTLALRSYPVGDKTVKEFLNEVRDHTIRAFENQDYQFEDLVDRLTVNRDTGRNPLFDVMFAFQSIPLPAADAGNLALSPYRYESRVSKFDLSLVINEMDGQLAVKFEYSTTLFKRDTVEGFIRYFNRIASAVMEAPGSRIADIEIMSPAEKREVLYDMNDTLTPSPPQRTIHGLFMDQAARTPDHIALVGQGLGRWTMEALTYRELNTRSDQLAHLLAERGVRPDVIAALLLGRSLEMIIGIIGILKAGGAYLPVDPKYPQERIDYMLADCGAEIILTGHSLSRWSRLDRVSHAFSPSTHPGAESLAYVIYTSGSTGRPKGVLIQHASVVNLVRAQKRYFDLDENDRILQFSSICFDASVEQIFIAFGSGAVLVLVTEETLLDSDKFEGFITDQGITHVDAVPSFLATMKLKDNSRYRLKRIISGGDDCPVSLGRRLSEYGDFYNEYGPTETTVTSIGLKVERERDLEESLPRLGIGKPIANTTVYILDRWNKPVPSGVVGELYIGGEGVGRGYLNRPSLSGDKFIDNPFRAGERLYRSGDLARRLSDGNIEFLGRRDQQVKIRGYRIEVAEIENHLLKHQALREAVVTVGEDTAGATGKFLTAYITADKELGVSSLRSYLSRRIPAYMIPAYFVQLDRLPRTPAGKLDRSALPDPREFRLHQQETFVAPRTGEERIVAEAWKEVLKLERVGIHDNFFDIGGNSLHMIRVNHRLKEVLGQELPIMAMFRYTTIHAYCQFLNRQGEGEIAAKVDGHIRKEARKQGKDDIRQRYQKRRQKQMEKKETQKRDMTSQRPRQYDQ